MNIRYARRTKSRKYNGKCECCNKKTPLAETYCYIDDCNASINYYTPYLCKECYLKKHPGEKL